MKTEGKEKKSIVEEVPLKPFKPPRIVFNAFSNDLLSINGQ
jgi:hypothetical protein